MWEVTITTHEELRDRLEELAATVRALHGELDSLSERLVRLEASAQVSAAATDSLRADLGRAIAHLGELQTDHDRVKTTQWSHEESVQRLKALWSDAQRDMTSLAEALARLDRG